jgi:hypothetical protein
MVETLESHDDELIKRKLEKQRFKRTGEKENAASFITETAEDEKLMPILVEGYVKMEQKGSYSDLSCLYNELYPENK